jgi:hypothetical protein
MDRSAEFVRNLEALRVKYKIKRNFIKLLEQKRKSPYLSRLPCGLLARCGRHDVARMDDRDVGVPREVPIVEREQLWNAVRQHCRDKPGIMHLNARYRARDNQPAPLGVDAAGVGQERELALNQFRAHICLRAGQAKAFLWPGRVHTFQNSTRF